jgi:hypothetical protein
LEEIRENCKVRVKRSRDEIMARLPMDKRRVQSEKIDGLLNQAMGNFLASLPREKILLLLERELMERVEEVCRFTDMEETGELRYRGLTEDELVLFLKKLSRISLKPAEDALYGIPGVLPALVIDLPHVRLSASVDTAASRLLLDKRAELAAALLGEAVLESGGVRP